MRYAFLLLLFILPFKNNAQVWFGFGSTKKDYVQFLKNTNPDKYDLYELTQNKEYDSIIGLCYAKIKDNRYALNIESYYAFLASTYYLKGMKDSAYSCAFNHLKEKSMGNFYLGDIIDYSNYMMFFPLASDEYFQKKILDFYITEYKKGYFPNKILGTILIELEYYDQRIRQLDIYSELVIKDTIKRKEAHENNLQFMQKIGNRYISILKYHPDYITEAEVGSAFTSQFILMYHVSDDSIRKTIIQPMLKRALDKKEIDPETYVDQLGRTALLNKSIKPEELQAYSDSLCKKYNCHVLFDR